MSSGEHRATPLNPQQSTVSWRYPPHDQEDLLLRGSSYLQAVRSVAPDSAWIELPGNSAERLRACTWIGASIHQVNRHLSQLLQTCLACFPINNRAELEILAAPMAPYTGLDGFCNDAARPITIVIDPSRARPSDWLHLVAHEVAHGITPVPGHGPEFGASLTQLCIALDLPLPPVGDAAALQTWPPYRPHPQGNQFWLGTTDLTGLAWGG